MLYRIYQAQSALLAPVRSLSKRAGGRLTSSASSTLTRRVAAAGTVLSGAKLTHIRPDFGITSVKVGRRTVGVTENVVMSTPFASLLHFAKAGRASQPKVLLVAPMSGHFATMLRPTVQTMLADHDVYITDWHNGRDIPRRHGRFGFDEYVQHLIDFITHLGPDTHVVAVCQPSVPAVVATAVLAQREDAVQPASLTLMAGPIDTRANPTKINAAADKRPLEWYRRNCIATVPRPYAGHGRRVYPGFLQVSAFMSMNFRRHVDSHLAMYRALVNDDAVSAEVTKTFYEEYFAVLDIPQEFYLETVDRVFQRQLLAKGEMTFQGEPVRPDQITETPLLTVEAERDDMCAPGQTEAAHKIMTGLSDSQRRHHVQAGVGHYGVFSGKRWEAEIYPVIRDFITSAARVPAVRLHG